MKIYLYLVLMIILATSIKGDIDCMTIEVLTTNDLPCQIITSYPYENSCNTYTIKFYNSSPALVGQTLLDDYTGTGLCNTSFNMTFNKTGSYTFNVSSGESGRLQVEVDETMMIALSIVFSALMILFIIIGIYLLMRSK